MNEGLMLVDNKIVKYANLQRDDTVMFMYLGSGEFDIVVYDTDRLEKKENGYENKFGKIDKYLL